MRISDWSSDVCSSDLMPVQASSTVQATTPFGDYLSHAFPRRPRSDAPGPFFVARAGAIVLQGNLLRHSHILRSGRATPSHRSLSSRGLSLRCGDYILD